MIPGRWSLLHGEALHEFGFSEPKDFVSGQRPHEAHLTLNRLPVYTLPCTAYASALEEARIINGKDSLKKRHRISVYAELMPLKGLFRGFTRFKLDRISMRHEGRLPSRGDADTAQTFGWPESHISSEERWMIREFNSLWEAGNGDRWLHSNGGRPGKLSSWLCFMLHRSYGTLGISRLSSATALFGCDALVCFAPPPSSRRTNPTGNRALCPVPASFDSISTLPITSFLSGSVYGPHEGPPAVPLDSANPFATPRNWFSALIPRFAAFSYSTMYLNAILTHGRLPAGEPWRHALHSLT
jgi:hypothetical protein